MTRLLPGHCTSVRFNLPELHQKQRRRRRYEGETRPDAPRSIHSNVPSNTCRARL